MAVRRLSQFLSNHWFNSLSYGPLSDERKALYIPFGILKQRQLCRILEHKGWEPCGQKSEVSAFAGWGRKKSGIEAKKLAKLADKPFFSLEDGFIRSVGLGQRGEPPLSIIMDATGIYYDSTTPSDLELRLNNSEIARTVDLERSRSAMELLNRTRISKYNQSGKEADFGVNKDGYILVIDQTRDDPSISYGMASAQSFADMLIAAKYENPRKKIIVKTHPGVIAGVAKGHYSYDEPSVEFFLHAINPWLLLEGAEKVYTVSSGMGMEALIAGKYVRCFGAPYYSGYGLTHDEIEIDRRSKNVSLENLFSAAYLEYPTYYDPYTDRVTNFERTVETLAFLRAENEQNRSKTYCLGMSKWKQPSVAAFLRSTYQEPLFMRSTSKALAKAKSENARLVIWASKCKLSFEEECQAASVPLLKMEDGFLRSNGLGSNLIPPLSLVLDCQGIYYDPRYPSELETLIECGEFSKKAIEASFQVQSEIVRSGLTKYNVGKRIEIENLPPDGSKLIILVPGQVGDDASIRLGTSGSEIKTNIQLLEATRIANPEAFIIYKPHPDVEAGNRYGRVAPHQALLFANYIASEVSTSYVLDICDEVWTLTSLMGLEALIRKKKVVCFGLPFYAGWGLTSDRSASDRRVRRASLDEIFAAAYLVYSKYVFHGLDGYMRMPPAMAPAILMDKKR